MTHLEKADIVQDMCREIITDIINKYTQHCNKMGQTATGIKPPVLTEEQKAALARSLASALNSAGIADHRNIDRKFHDAVAFNVGRVIGVPVGFVNGLLSNLPCYSSFMAGLSYGHAQGFSIEQRVQAWSTVKVGNMFENAPWRKAPEHDKQPQVAAQQATPAEPVLVDAIPMPVPV